jgi:methionyl-tRNA formyltransferase
VVIAFFGTPQFAVPSLEALIASGRHTVVAVISQPDRPKGRGQQLQPTPTKLVAEAHGIPVFQPTKIREEAFLDRVRALNLDLGVVVAYGRILPDALLAIPRLGMINVHASLLPRYRGAAPIQRAVLAGDAETGVTIMRVERELDAGPMFAMKSVPIPPDATSGDMESVLATLGAELLIPVVDALADGRALETPQDHARATLAPKITKDEGVLDWTQPASLVHNRVRGLQPWPLASTTLAGTRYVIRRTAHVFIRRTEPVADAELPAPGTIFVVTSDTLLVACGKGQVLQILEIQPEGRRTMTAREFLAGRGAIAGARFGS